MTQEDADAFLPPSQAAAAKPSEPATVEAKS
jgi:hypothetical protein